MSDDNMTKRQRTTIIKRQLREAFPDLQFRVNWGRGTSHSWVYIYWRDPSGVRQKFTLDERDKLDAIAGEHAGSHFPDACPGRDTWETNVLVQRFT